jgi:hypothetical protein
MIVPNGLRKRKATWHGPCSRENISMNVRDRIKELRRVPAKELRPNPRNWRTHPKAQHEALRGLLAEIGYADALLARECGDGALMLVDGHLRAETTPEALVPVLVLDITEAEADKLLLTLDPLAGLAQAHAPALEALLRDVHTSNSAVADMLARLAEVTSVPLPAPDQEAVSPHPPEEFPAYGEAIETDHRCPKCGYQWSGKPQ